MTYLSHSSTHNSLWVEEFQTVGTNPSGIPCACKYNWGQLKMNMSTWYHLQKRPPAGRLDALIHANLTWTPILHIYGLFPASETLQNQLKLRCWHDFLFYFMYFAKRSLQLYFELNLYAFFFFFHQCPRGCVNCTTEKRNNVCFN